MVKSEPRRIDRSVLGFLAARDLPSRKHLPVAAHHHPRHVDELFAFVIVRHCPLQDFIDEVIDFFVGEHCHPTEEQAKLDCFLLRVSISFVEVIQQGRDEVYECDFLLNGKVRFDMEDRLFFIG